VFVHASVHERLLSALVSKTDKLRVSPGDDPATQVAPMVHHRHRDKVAGLGREKGRQGIAAYLRQKSVYLGLDEAPLPWAG
jgi:aldehyde dehydrogenase (NAD+)